jgi:hypothetical protein
LTRFPIIFFHLSPSRKNLFSKAKTAFVLTDFTVKTRFRLVCNLIWSINGSFILLYSYSPNIQPFTRRNLPDIDKNLPDSFFFLGLSVFVFKCKHKNPKAGVLMASKTCCSHPKLGYWL